MRLYLIHLFLFPSNFDITFSIPVQWSVVMYFFRIQYFRLLQRENNTPTSAYTFKVFPNLCTPTSCYWSVNSASVESRFSRIVSLRPHSKEPCTVSPIVLHGLGVAGMREEKQKPFASCAFVTPTKTEQCFFG